MRRNLTALALVMTLTGLAHAELPSASEATVRKALASGKPVLIDLGARSCKPCQEMAPILQSLAAEYRGRAEILFIDVYKDEKATGRFRVQAIPTQVLFSAQGKEMDRHMGFMGKADLVKGLKAAGVR